MQKRMHLAYAGSMVAVQIRDVPDALRDVLAQEAKRRGTSLQGYLLGVLEREAASASNRRSLDAARERARRTRSAIGGDAILVAIAEARQDGRA